MLDIQEIKNTIKQLENEPTTFATCQKLANLYTVLDHIEESKPKVDKVVNEYSDILPSYNSYCATKRKYELNEMTEDALQLSMKTLCQEIGEFLQVIYSNTETEFERNEFKSMMKSLTLS